MARRRRNGRFAPATKIVRVGAPRAASPIIRIATSQVKRRFGSRRRVRRTASQFGGFVSQHNIDGFLGGVMYGYAVRQGWVDKLPNVPLIGRTGAAAIGLDYISKRGAPFLRKAAIAASVLSGYQLGHDGKITGDEDVSGLSTTGFDTAGDYEGE